MIIKIDSRFICIKVYIFLNMCANYFTIMEFDEIDTLFYGPDRLIWTENEFRCQYRYVYVMKM